MTCIHGTRRDCPQCADQGYPGLGITQQAPYDCDPGDCSDALESILDDEGRKLLRDFRQRPSAWNRLAAMDPSKGLQAATDAWVAAMADDPSDVQAATFPTALQNAWRELTEAERDAHLMAGMEAYRRHRHEGPADCVRAIADALING